MTSRTTQAPPELLTDLWRVVLALRNETECREFFTDLCTPAELKALADRWQVAQLVEQGLPYREINDLTGTSTATVTRVARALSLGEGGYRTMLDRRQDTKRSRQGRRRTGKRS